MIIDCYHGTTSSRAYGIYAQGFIKSRKPRMWLGTGSYFFQDGYQASRAWAEQVCRRPGAKAEDSPAVLHAKINMNYGIDLLGKTYWPLLRAIYSKHKAELDALQQNGIDTLVRSLTPQERLLDFDHPFDHRLIDLLFDVETLNRRLQRLPEPTMVRAAFVEGRPVEPRSWLFDRAAVIVSVVDPRCIVHLKVIT